MNIQHDMHRPIGWARPLGLYIDSSMVRTIAEIYEPENDEEQNSLEQRIGRFWEFDRLSATDPYRDELAIRVAPVDLEGARFLKLEAAVVARTGIAEELYPELFVPGSELVDKDGLADYRNLVGRMKQVLPGVFHDPGRDLLLFAHRFFRRSLSHRNKLNEYFLQSLVRAATEDRDVRVRLRLDPDILGHPSSVRGLIELEYWHGPKYTDDIAGIPDGVAEHKADERTRLFEGIDRTQIWWKPPEQRRSDKLGGSYRTFELEELIENPSVGLAEDHYGCRYAHAEFSAEVKVISHFDGAIRAYGAASYLERIDKAINRAGKHAHYTKLFRFDGGLTIPKWKRLLTDFFRGNNLIPEYFGAPVEEDGTVTTDALASNPTPALEKPALAVLVSVKTGSSDSSLRLCADSCLECAGRNIPFVEVGTGSVGTYLRTRLDLGEVMTVGISDEILNMARLQFGAVGDLKGSFDTEVLAIAEALEKDIREGSVRSAAIPLTWEEGGLLVTLTVAGEAFRVASVLRQLPSIVDPTKAAPEWIEGLSLLIKANSPLGLAPVMWSHVEHGVLSFQRASEVELEMRVPEALRQQLLDASSNPLDRSAAAEG